MNARWGGWLLTGALHAALLLAVLGVMNTRPARPAAPLTISARLVAAEAPRAAAPLLSPAMPRALTEMPSPAPLPVPTVEIAVAPPIQPAPSGGPASPAALLAQDPPAAAAPAPVTVAMAMPVAAVAPTPAAPVEQAAALPADHRQCSERQTARHYPAMLRDRGIQGLVRLRVKVDENGHAAEVVVAAGSGFRLLDEAARRVAESCPYLPARRGDQRLASWVEYPVRFALQAAALQ